MCHVLPPPCSVIMETDPAVLTHRIAVKAEDGEQSVKNVSLETIAIAGIVLYVCVCAGAAVG